MVPGYGVLEDRELSTREPLEEAPDPGLSLTHQGSGERGLLGVALALELLSMPFTQAAVGVPRPWVITPHHATAGCSLVWGATSASCTA